MLEVIGVGVFYTKIVDDKSEGYVSYVLAEEAVRVLSLGVAVFFKEGAELCVC